jgi:hypothetical protein
LLSTLPKLADRRFILGFFLPSLLFVLALMWVLGGGNARDQLWGQLMAKEPLNAAYLILATWVLAVLLLALNDVLYRIYSGQFPPLSWATRSRQRAQQARQALAARVETLHRQWSQHGVLSTDDRREYNDKRRQLFLSYPRNTDRVLATRFGNAFRAFQDYSNTVYGADAVAVWPRLIAVLPRDVLEKIEDARCQVDFFLNTGYLALVVGAVAIVRLVAHFDLPSALYVAAAIAVARAAYALSIDHVMAWGELVRSAFDGYLPALATLLGFTLPATRKARRQFWRDFSNTASFGADPDGNVRFAPEYWDRAPK